MSDATNLFSVRDLVDLLQMQHIDEYRFLGHSPLSGTPRIYGGQLVAQSLTAMGRTVRSEHRLHSMHGYFLHPGDIEGEVLFEVQPIRDGRNFSTRSLTAMQYGRLIYTGSASFHGSEGDHDRFEPMPAVSAPEALESEDDFLARHTLPANARSNYAPFFTHLFERRSSLWRRLADPGVHAPRNGVWCRLREPVGVDPLLHQVLIAYLSDLDLMNTAMRPRGIASLDPAASAASLDHAMWFHAPARADQWLYYDLDGPCATNNRGLGAGAIYQHGHRVITAMQEGLLRVQR